MKSQKKKHGMEFYEMQNNLVFKSYNILKIKRHMIAFIKL